ncbi:O-antigen ligase family protein [Scytonema sp. PCC 10023]|uniref:O-antigen ligase family protein n=1 Tax=Scytonema sp. PCC 10023 TaxID=1680591 RepID=UPI0039C7311A
MVNHARVYTNTHNITLQPKNSGTAPLLEVQRTKWLFLALCFYLLSQSFTIPILPIGPSWALWPYLSDFAIGLLVLIFLLNFRCNFSISNSSKNIFFLLIVVFLGSVLSYLLYLDSLGEKQAIGVNFGIFQIYRLVQFILVFFITAHIPLTPERINFLRRIVDGVFIFVCLGIVLTYTGIVPLSTVIAHLPKDGPWIFYEAYERSGGGKGLGFVGYNYAYTAVQVIMLVSLRIHLALNQQKEFSNNIFLLVSIIACFLSDSRAGLAAMLFLAIIYWWQKPKYILILITTAWIISTISLVIGLQTLDLNSSNHPTFERQETLLEVNNTETLSGRDEIWIERLAFINEEPTRWLVGTGFGSALDSGDNAHMLPLHIILETGIFGLLIAVFLFSQILKCLYLDEAGCKPIFWGSVALLLSSTTQETFYPVPALAHFLGFYLCCLAIALRKEVCRTKDETNFQKPGLKKLR